MKRLRVKNETANNKYLVFFSGRAFPELVEEIVAAPGANLVLTRALAYANSEVCVRFGESVHDYDAFVIQSHTAPVNEWVIEQLIMMDVLKRASAKRITVVTPFYPYARQNKRHLGREPISARLVTDLYRTTGAGRTMSVDLHALQIQGFFDDPVDHLWGLPMLNDYVQEHYDASEICVVSPDAGRVRLADMWTNELGRPLMIIHKRHDHETASTVVVYEVVGDVWDRTCILVNGMINTAGTITQVALTLQEREASKVICAATHAVFSRPAVEQPNKLGVAEIVMTNTLPIRTAEPIDNLATLSIAPLITRAINVVFHDGSVASLFERQAYE